MTFRTNCLDKYFNEVVIVILSRNFKNFFFTHFFKQGLEVIESTNLKYFTKEMTAEFYALKGMFLAQINKYVCHTEGTESNPPGFLGGCLLRRPVGRSAGSQYDSVGVVRCGVLGVVPLQRE